MLLSDLLTPDRIRVPIHAAEKPGVLRELTDLLAGREGVDAGALLGAIEEREAVLSTGIGHGIAFPHARASGVQQLSLVCGSRPVGVPFDSVDGEPVRLFFLLIAPEHAAGQHVKALSRIARLVRRESTREALLAAPTPEVFHQVLVDAEER